MDNPRAVKLRKHFDSIISGKQPLTRSNNPLFIEAICAAPDAAAYIHKLISSDKGLICLQASMRFDLSVAFFNGSATTLLSYISSSDLTSIGGGSFLQPVLLSITEPPIFWTPFKEAFQAGLLQEKAQACFAWLLLQLISLPGEPELVSSYREIAQDPCIIETLLSSSNYDVRSIAQRIQHIIATCSIGAAVDFETGPGGRHDNDFVDFREIAILPTADELISKEPAFLRPSAILDDPDTKDTRIATHLDNQFRLLREDMVYEMREELQIILALKKGKHRSFRIDGLTVLDIHYKVSDDKKCKWGITLQCHDDPFKGIKAKDRKAYLDENRKLFRHQSMACLLVDEEIVAFPTINRDENLLTQTPPIIVLQLEGQKSTTTTLLRLHRAKPEHIRLLQIDTAVFSYEPVLKALQEKQNIPLSSELFFWTNDTILESPSGQASTRSIVETIRADPGQNLQRLLNISRSVKLDKAQANSLVSGLSQRVSLIQGPPGTGKSFIGALLAKVLHDFAKQTILVVCYTNHALDQFLEDLLDIGIPEASIVRLGGKSSARTANLALQKQTRTYKLGRPDWQEINELKSESNSLSDELVRNFQEYKQFNPFNKLDDILEYLEFEHSEYFEAFLVPQTTDGMRQVGRKGRDIRPDYLLERWVKGNNAGIFNSAPHVKEAREIWSMPHKFRSSQVKQWSEDMLKDLVERFCTGASRYNECQNEIERKFNQSNAAILRDKRIIGCTTTGAAKYREDISAARPDVLLVEEAGEILESHILTALAPETKRLILIGDHNATGSSTGILLRQLRPKVNHYLLTVEKGEGYDLNRSLFERLVLKGYPHETLRIQHRMRPEISSLVQQLTYPELLDDPKTQGRPDLRGVRDNVVFINHDKPEDEVLQLEERRDPSTKSSKQNMFEVQMILKIVRYLAQQGYGTDKIVILTPYLGQLRELKEELKKDNDPILNDLDSYDLVRAGLLSASAAKISKRPIHLATIDNYQGEESDIVIVSLTRSNSNNDIGFMSSPERLTVLLSRARNAFIMVGNAQTFMHARKGNEIWIKLFDLLGNNGHIYDGLPVRCERHTDRIALLKSPDDFDKECPDGGCPEPWYVPLASSSATRKPSLTLPSLSVSKTILNCGIHHCTSKCHQLSDHSKMLCEYIMYSKCPKSHQQQWKCHKGPPPSCAKCDREKKVEDKRKQEEFARQEKRDEEQRLHARKLTEIEDQIARERDAIRDVQLAEERKYALEQKEKDLKDVAALAAQATSLASRTKTAPPPKSTPPSRETGINSSYQPKTDAPSKAGKRNTESKPVPPPAQSAAREEWQRRKDVDGEVNDAIDAIMEMVGLEDVKQQVLVIKDKVDIVKRQNSDLKGERFNVSMLGNPGTGKTTVARHYGKFLASVQVIPGSLFIETTGSGLAQDGIPGIKKKIETVINAGGGTIFVDEAYQLTGQHNFQGGQVLDYLLAEMENHVGKIVFIFAGYNKEMEKFFEHNPGLPSRVPFKLQFKDYEDSELLGMLENLIEKRFEGKMKVEDGIRGLYGRIAVSRLGRGRGQNGFGNARALGTLFDKIRQRQAARISQERRQGQQPDDFLLVKEDFIGPDPSKVMAESAAWTKLQSMIGLGAVKKSVANFFSMVSMNYERELLEKSPYQVSLNRVFLGSPGTGKTTVAKLYGRILADLGLISNGEVVMKNPADFIGSALGQSEEQTKTILASTVGKVLIIDEAYMLYGGSGSKGTADPYKTAVIDTIVAEVQSVPGEDRCVLLLGYKQQIEEMFQNVNPGLARRFAIENAFHFEDYSDPELLQALEWKLKDQDLSATDAAKTVAIEVLSRARNRPNFGNIGEVENLLSQAKTRYQERQASMHIGMRSPDAPFEPTDFDPEFDRGKHAVSNLAKLFEDVTGCEDIIEKLRGWQQMAQNVKSRRMDPRDFVPTNFVFKGPPGKDFIVKTHLGGKVAHWISITQGTGKTTTARKMGQVFYDMGLLASTEVVECSASDLVGEYVGQTGPKTSKLFEKALGRVLFIDEAYRLSEGHFAKEAMDELVGILTQERYRAKLVVIIAGYDQEMNDLLSVNTGLSSRFPEEIVFQNMNPAQCLEVLKKKLRKQSIQVGALEDHSCTEYTRMVDLLAKLSLLPSWGNARDIETLSKQMAVAVFSSPYLPGSVSASTPNDLTTLSGKKAVDCIHSMLAGRRERVSNMPTRSDPFRGMQQMIQDHQAPPPPAVHTTHTTVQSAPPAPQPETAREMADEKAESDIRDAGVTDQVWRQLQMDKHAAAEAKRRFEEAERTLREAAEREEAAKKLAKKLAEAQAKDAAERAELMRQREKARLEEIAAMQERARRAAALQAEERERREEARVQAKIRQMGVTNGEELLKKYDLKADDAILAEEKHISLYDEIVAKHKITYVAGGAAQNAARGAAYVLPPNSVVYTGCVGDDELAEQLKAANRREGLHEAYLVKKGEKTGACAVVITGHHRSLVTTLRSAEKFDKAHLSTPEVARLIDAANVFYVEGYFLTHGIESAVEVAKKASDASKVFVLNLSAPFIPQFFKVQLEQIFSYCDIIIGNESEAAAWASASGLPDNDIPSIAKSLASLPKSNPSRPRIVIITQGPSSTILVSSTEPNEPKIFPVDALSDTDIIDTNGAGDAFAGGFLGGFVAGKSLDECVLAGHKMGAMCVQQVGPQYKWPKVNIL
ncbi:hypothetical protein EW146_g2397 [Bondarzewia mesenterica]|uniref:AAA+ ATPase domain-containing protein n=1 Tax=Bondarzewia mesenterica TaxID=1095465 RepID=A0A4S4M0R7_9AGAM|nr:hypothetical protein EW146_g2397 [Bondarzewia mesenterica]